ncbi:CMP-N-acetylneuraminate-beta-galactosamide-alpha-2,3-sialyltransferase 1-like [Cheilinus undulatus]|uniref:CMP-N-acetylneuraminate-beta-galactosamide- alpha-2,3-sialyltransferase 1-like n=1 Tax=Cheilinus undulatus TaxID=241271 RepID=UPI001BD2D2B6|nr:CMP-N-acetylneuraminate-beta-galactosamide-alpha-2,3-sialyltransferase 1-like [Cheilinus undulatus]
MDVKKFGLYSIKPTQHSHCKRQKCVKDGDQVLGVKINSSPVPFLSKDSSISSDDFKWWKRMQNEKCNRTYFNMIVDKLFEIIPPIPPYEKASPECCRTCAVVGNSGNMKESHFGELIDAHDFVIRINKGPTKGYEEDVGTKTTHHVAFPESAVNLSSTTHLVLVTFKIRDLEWVLTNFKPE